MSWGRNDRPFYGRGLRTMRNFFPTRQHGAAVSRPGSMFITTTRDNNTGCRLLPFVYADGDAYVLEVGKCHANLRLYFRFLKQGVQLTAKYLPLNLPAAQFHLGELVTGGTSGATGRILAINVRDDAPLPKLQLRVLSGVFQAGEAITGDAGGIGVSAGVVTTEPFEIQSGTITNNFNLDRIRFAQTGAVLTLAHPDFPPQELRRFVNDGNEPRWELSSVAFEPALPYFDPMSSAGSYPVLLEPLGAPDAQHPEREWIYLCTLTVQERNTGRIFETYPWRVVEAWDGSATPPHLFSPDVFAVYPDMAVTIRRGGHLEVDGSSIGITGPTKNRNFPNDDFSVLTMNVYRGRGRLFGLVGTTNSSDFVDNGAEPNYAIQPPLGSNPFAIYGPGGGLEVVENPSAVAFYQDRRVFAGTERRPTSVWASATGEYTNFDLHELVHVAGESLLFELAARRFEQAVHLLSHEKLIIGTKSSVWSMSGAGGGVLDFDSVDARVVDEVGMTDVAPLIIDGMVVYGRTKGAGVRGLVYDGQFGVYSPRDLSGQADHLFLGKATGVVGAVAAKQIVDWTYAEDPFGLVWAVRNDGTLLSLSLGPDGAYGWAHHDGEPTSKSAEFGYGTPAAWRRVCAVPESNEDAVYQVVSRAIGGVAEKVCIERMTSRVRRGDTTDDVCVDCAVEYSGVLTQTLTGLEHLEGESVYVIGKGNAPVGPLVVDGGEVTLPSMPIANTISGNVVLYVGLLFVADLELLDVVSTDTRLKQKAVTRVGFEVDQTAGLKVGTDFAHLVDTRPHTVVGSYDPPVPGSVLISASVPRGWGVGGRAALRQSLPLPVTVVGAVRELEMGG